MAQRTICIGPGSESDEQSLPMSLSEIDDI